MCKTNILMWKDIFQIHVSSCLLMVCLHRNCWLPFNVIRWYLKELSNCINSLSTSFLFIMFGCVILGLLFTCSMKAGTGCVWRVWYCVDFASVVSQKQPWKVFWQWMFTVSLVLLQTLIYWPFLGRGRRGWWSQVAVAWLAVAENLASGCPLTS